MTTRCLIGVAVLCSISCPKLGLAAENDNVNTAARPFRSTLLECNSMTSSLGNLRTCRSLGRKCLHQIINRLKILPVGAHDTVLPQSPACKQTSVFQKCRIRFANT